MIMGCVVVKHIMVCGQCCVEISHGMSKYWYPYCEHNLKPYVGQTFGDLGEALKFYTLYVASVEFDIRNGIAKMSRGVVDLKYVLCSQQGYKNMTVGNT